MNVRQIVAGIALAAMVNAADTAQAQNPVSGTPSLTKMPCQNIQGQYLAVNQDISVGLEISRAVAVFGNSSTATWQRNFIPSTIPNGGARVVCLLAPADQSPRFRTLRLAFGFRDDARNASQSTARLTIYKDGNLLEYRDITGGNKLLWNVDVSGTRSLALQATCQKKGFLPLPCPAVYFSEDILEQ